MAHGPKRPLFLPMIGFPARAAIGVPPVAAAPTSQLLDETGAVTLGLEWHSDLFLLEDSE